MPMGLPFCSGVHAPATIPFAPHHSFPTSILLIFWISSLFVVGTLWDFTITGYFVTLRLFVLHTDTTPIPNTSGDNQKYLKTLPFGERETIPLFKANMNGHSWVIQHLFSFYKTTTTITWEQTDPRSKFKCWLLSLLSTGLGDYCLELSFPIQKMGTTRPTSLDHFQT